MGLTRFLGAILILTSVLAVSQFPAFAAGSMTLTWNPSADSNVTGYRIYYGVASRNYTNIVDTGNATSVTISSLVEGVTYYFAATAYNVLAMESAYSGEIFYTVPSTAVNKPPTLNALSNLTVNKGAGQQTVNLSGISSGASNEVQTLTVSAVSSNPGLIPTPTVTYTSPNTSGSLTFTPVALANGVATITVAVNDGGASNNVVTRSFTVTVNNTAQASGVQIRVAPTRQVILTVTGQVGSTYNIQASPDFTTWTVIGTVTVGASGSVQFADTNAAILPALFYRVVEILPSKIQIRVAPTRQVILTVTGQVGSANKIQASPDSITWTVIGTVVVPAGGSLDFTDTNAVSFPKRFYRTQ